MADIDPRISALSAGFLHALKASPDLYRQWAAVERTPDKVGPFIQKTMGLASPPSAADLKAMAAYADEHLSDQMGALRAEHPEEHPHVGSAFGVTQS